MRLVTISTMRVRSITVTQACLFLVAALVRSVAAQAVTRVSSLVLRPLPQKRPVVRRNRRLPRLRTDRLSFLTELRELPSFSHKVDLPRCWRIGLNVMST